MKMIYIKLAAIANGFFFAWLLHGRKEYIKKIFVDYKNDTNKNNKKHRNNWHAKKADSFDINTIVNYFESHKPYLDKNLSLEVVADQIGIHKQQLSYIINNKLYTHFPDLLSTYRVKEAQQKLLDPVYHNYTIDAIAEEAGFNSRANFYEAFKKHTRLTPTQYRKKFERRVEVNKENWEPALV